MIKNKTIKRIILAGKAASGKDFGRKHLEELGLSYGVSYTTRSPRPGEIDGVDYNFISPEKFDEMEANHEWYEEVEFNGWKYGTSNAQFHGESNVFIMTPHGLSLVHPEDLKESLVVFFDIPYDVRYSRLKERGDTADKLERRLEADENDFKHFTEWDIKVSNPGYNIVEDVLFPAIEKGIIFNDSITDKLANNEIKN